MTNENTNNMPAAPAAAATARKHPSVQRIIDAMCGRLNAYNANPAEAEAAEAAACGGAARGPAPAASPPAAGGM